MVITHTTLTRPVCDVRRTENRCSSSAQSWTPKGPTTSDPSLQRSFSKIFLGIRRQPDQAQQLCLCRFLRVPRFLAGINLVAVHDHGKLSHFHRHLGSDTTL